MKNNLATLSSLTVTQVYHTFQGAVNATLNRLEIEGQYEVLMTNPYHRDDLWKAAHACVAYTPTDPDVYLESAVQVDAMEWAVGYIYVWGRRGSDKTFYTLGKDKA